MNVHLQDMLEKLKSDRLWALVGFVALAIANSKYAWIASENMKEIMWATITFIAGKSIRGSTVGGIIETITNSVATKMEPGMPAVHTTLTTATEVQKRSLAPEDAP